MAQPSESAAPSRALRTGARVSASRDDVEVARRDAIAAAAAGRGAVAWHNLGNARWRRGDRDGAIDAYRRAVAGDPAHAPSPADALRRGPAGSAP